VERRRRRDGPTCGVGGCRRPICGEVFVDGAARGVSVCDVHLWSVGAPRAPSHVDGTLRDVVVAALERAGMRAEAVALRLSAATDHELVSSWESTFDLVERGRRVVGLNVRLVP